MVNKRQFPRPSAHRPAENEDEKKLQEIRDRRRRQALIAVARTPEGRLVLHELVEPAESAAALEPRGGALDYFERGRVHAAGILRRRLKDELPRHLYLEIVYPEEDS